MTQQLLWIEIVLKGTIGLLLVVMPKWTAYVLGLPPVTQAFWARMAGSALAGIAAAVALGAWLGKPGGIGLAGLVAINFAAAVVLVLELSVGTATPARRGRALLWLAALSLAALGLAELAQV